jgi:hypothetical protein
MWLYLIIKEDENEKKIIPNGDSLVMRLTLHYLQYVKGHIIGDRRGQIA